MGARPQCYLDVEINREPVGRIVFQLFSDVCPKTCLNFLCLCTGEKGIGKETGKRLCFKGSTFHRVVKNFIIQGGDFSEGTGKGGESIYGGYFKDENFILKHDRAFLLSMANRGKHTNGSQFFITTKAAPHLDGIHVVFGLVISGFEVIEQIENQKTDAASRPYADVRIVDCGKLGSKPAKDVPEKVKHQSEESASSSSSSSSSSSPSPSPSSSESSSSDSEMEAKKNKRKRKSKAKAKVKHSKKRRKEYIQEVTEERPASQHSTHSEKSAALEDKESTATRDKPVVRPEEIPPVPENRFLLRKDAPKEMKNSAALPENSESMTGSITKSGRKIRGRGTIRYHTPPRSRSRSVSDDRGSSETPPHWKEEMQRLKAYKPPSGEKWSKGDKLNDRLSSRWDEGSVSSRSSSWSHDGYRSDDSRERTSRSKTRKRDKKIKHKKKAKKAKHGKKHKPSKKDVVSGSHAEETLSKATKTQDRSSSRGSSRKDWSPSSGHSSKRSFGDSKSRSRSYSRERSKSTSRSRSSSSQSKSKSKSKSRKRNVSGAHSSTRSHQSSKRLRSSPPSSLKKDKNKPNSATEPGKLAVSTNSAKETLSPSVPAKSAPLISLSDSPPPSRWKPGQKPWKPSYERTQEVKAKTADGLGAQKKRGAAAKRSSSRNRHASSDSDRSDASKRSSSYRRKEKRRPSPSRSYSRSYSRSRSRSSSSSRVYSSSSSDSNDDASPSKVKKKSKTKSLKKEAQEKPLSQKSTRSYSESHSSSESDEFTKSLLRSTKALLERHHSHSADDKEKPKAAEGAASRSEKGSSSDKDGTQTQTGPASRSERDAAQGSSSDKNGTQTVLLNIDKVLTTEKLKESIDQVIKEEKSHPQNDNIAEDSNMRNTNKAEDSVMSSGKEEGEASSESESEAAEKTPPSEPPSEKLAKSTPSDSSPAKSKSKKHKRHSSKKKSHSKKSREKSKKKKDKKQKSQKKRHTFHWQPPLEFGEEEDEEENSEVNTDILSKPKDILMDKSSVETKITPNGSLQSGKTIPPEKVLLRTPTIKSETKNGETLPSLVKSPLPAINVSLTPENIKAFTPHRSLPQIKREASKPSNNSPTSQTVQNALPSVALPSVAANIKDKEGPAKEEKSADAQPEAAPNTEKNDIPEAVAVDNKWKPVQGPTIVQLAKPVPAPVAPQPEPEKKPQGLRIEIKSKSKVKPGSLFDEVRKTARLNQRPRKKEESSSEERSSSDGEKSKSRSRSKSRSASSRRSKSYSRSRSRSRSSSSSSRSHSYTRSESRRRYRRYRSRTRSRSYGSYRSRSRSSSRSRSRSPSYRRRSRSRSYSYYSRSRSRSANYRRSRSYDRRSRSRRSSYSGSDRSYSRRRRR